MTHCAADDCLRVGIAAGRHRAVCAKRVNNARGSIDDNGRAVYDECYA